MEIDHVRRLRALNRDPAHLDVPTVCSAAVCNHGDHDPRCSSSRRTKPIPVARVSAPPMAKELEGQVIVQNAGVQGAPVVAPGVARLKRDRCTLYLYHIGWLVVPDAVPRTHLRSDGGFSTNDIGAGPGPMLRSRSYPRRTCRRRTSRNCEPGNVEADGKGLDREHGHQYHVAPSAGCPVQANPDRAAQRRFPTRVPGRQ